LIRISASPISATILLDGNRLAGNPAKVSADNDGTAHTVTIQATDHKSRTLSLVYDREQNVTVALEKSTNQEGTSSKTAVPPHPGTAAVQTSPPAAPKDCAPPYYLDERGIKRFKQGCI
jgi:serine/threonine-protein kinase